MRDSETGSSARYLWVPILFIAVAVVGWSLWNKPAPAEAPDKKTPASAAPKLAPVLGQIPWFELTDQHDRAYGTQDLYGKVWIANFIFTRCTATCPEQTSNLHKIQERLVAGRMPGNTRLVSISVDPEVDTPEVLHKYAEDNNADQKLWRFLTGDKTQIWDLCKDGFKLPVAEDLGSEMPISHSPAFIVVDAFSKVRGLFTVQSESDIDELCALVSNLGREGIKIPKDVMAPEWLSDRKADQLKSTRFFDVRHDFKFEYATDESKIRFVNRVVDDAAKSYKPVHYDHGSGVIVADVNADGRLDLYFTSVIGANGLWLNQGDGTFKDGTEEAGVALTQHKSITASFADIDNDGDPDLFVTGVRDGNVLLQNDGTGVFTDISKAAGVDHVAHSSGAVFFDYDKDGLLDLFVSNVGIYSSDEVATMGTHRVGIPDQGDPKYKYYVGYMDAFGGHVKPERNELSVLYRNIDGSRFEDVSEKTGLMDRSWTGDATPMDVNADGWVDLYVYNMQGEDHCYLNVEGKEFKAADTFRMTPWGTMGGKAFDFDNDNDIDLYLTDMHSDMSTERGADLPAHPRFEKKKSLMSWPDSYTKNRGRSIWGNAFFQNEEGKYAEVSDDVNAEIYWPWGVSVGDLNADGYQDMFVTSSMNFPYRYQGNSVLLNNKGKRFLDSEFILGVEPRPNGDTGIPWFELDMDGEDKDHLIRSMLEREGRVPKGKTVVWSAIGSRASIIFDLDDDGDLDVVTNDFNTKPLVLISDLASVDPDLKFVKVRLEGTKSNRDGLGAVVRLFKGEQVQMQVHDGHSGYMSHCSYPLYFGLDKSAEIGKIEVTWPSGVVQTVENPEANSTVHIKEAAAE